MWHNTITHVFFPWNHLIQINYPCDLDDIAIYIGNLAIKISLGI